MTPYGATRVAGCLRRCVSGQDWVQEERKSKADEVARAAKAAAGPVGGYNSGANFQHKRSHSGEEKRGYGWGQAVGSHYYSSSHPRSKVGDSPLVAPDEEKVGVLDRWRRTGACLGANSRVGSPELGWYLTAAQYPFAIWRLESTVSRSLPAKGVPEEEQSYHHGGVGYHGPGPWPSSAEISNASTANGGAKDSISGPDQWQRQPLSFLSRTAWWHLTHLVTLHQTFCQSLASCT